MISVLGVIMIAFHGLDAMAMTGTIATLVLLYVNHAKNVRVLVKGDTNS